MKDCKRVKDPIYGYIKIPATLRFIPRQSTIVLSIRWGSFIWES